MGRLSLLLLFSLPLLLSAQKLDSLIGAWELMPADTHKVQAAFHLGRKLMRTQASQTYYLTDRAACLGDSLGFTKAQFNAQMKYCYLAGYQGKWQEAHQHAQKMLAFSKRNPNANIIAVAQTEMAQTAMRLKLPETEKYFLEGIATADTLQKSHYVERIQYYYAIWLQNEGRYPEALTQLELLVQRESDSSLKGRQNLIRYYSILGRLWLTMEQADKAEPYIRKAYAYRKERNYLPQLTIGEQNMGVLFSQNGMSDSAIYYLKLASEHHRQLGNLTGLAGANNNLAAVYEKSGAFNELRQLYLEALNIYESTDLTDERIRTLLNLGLLEVKLGNTKRGMAYLKKGESQAQQSQNLILRRLAFKQLATALHQQSKHTQAYEYLGQYHSLKDSMLNVERLASMSEIEVKFEQEKKQKEISRLKEGQVQQEMLLVQSQLRNDRFLPVIISLLSFLGVAGLLAWWFWHRQGLRQQNQQSELQQRLLRSQMNPHFLFNALNSIQRLFQDQDTKRANEYLEGFGKLMNDILDQSSQAWIPLVDELRTLEVYMRMEQYRLENGFRYAIHLPEDIDVYQTQIPPLILQPLVENAIWHGIAPLEKEGLIEINLSLEEKYISCRIVDNGVGLSQEQNKTPQQHQPKALNILTERLGIESAFELRERKDIQGEVLGTEVHLLIPILVTASSVRTTK
ncbi:MAG: histidine kinase [Bacteroidia bacterium]